ncbi:MAG: WecB/TagA/CpsF family glycosyltransferase [Pirellulales bacterium]
MNKPDPSSPIDKTPLSLRLRAIGPRVFDLLIAGSLALLALPLWLAAGLMWAARLIVWTRTERLGEAGEKFHQFTWCWRRQPEKPCPVIGQLPTLLNVLGGSMAIVGPRAVSPGDPLLELTDSVWRFGVKPGLVCLWWIRQRANIDYGSEVDADYEYVATHGLKRDIGISLRALAALILGRAHPQTTDELQLLGLRIDNFTMQRTLDEIVRMANGTEPAQVCFLNADCVNIAWQNADYRETLRHARCTLADGVGLKLAGRLLGREIRQNVNGTDLFPRLCETISGTPLSIYLLGARPGVVEAVAEWVTRHYPDVRMAGGRHGYFTPQEEPEVVREIAESGASILMVAFGAPRQDLWIRQHLAATGVRVAMGVGGLFDFYSGRIPRAPQWMRELCLEWLYRVCVEPRRLWRRYLVGNVVFLWRAGMERLFGPPAWAATPRGRQASAEDAIVPRRRPVE